MKISKELEELFDLESAKKANESYECSSFDFYDPDLSDSMRSTDLKYACSLNADELLNQLFLFE